MSVLEKELPFNLKALVSNLLSALSVVLIISITTPLFIITLIPMIVVNFFIQVFSFENQLKKTNNKFSSLNVDIQKKT